MHHMTYLPTNIYIYRVVPKDHSGPLYKIGNAPSIEGAKPCKNKRKEEADPAVETIHSGRPLSTAGGVPHAQHAPTRGEKRTKLGADAGGRTLAAPKKREPHKEKRGETKQWCLQNKGRTPKGK